MRSTLSSSMRLGPRSLTVGMSTLWCKKFIRFRLCNKVFTSILSKHQAWLKTLSKFRKLRSLPTDQQSGYPTCNKSKREWQRKHQISMRSLMKLVIGLRSRTTHKQRSEVQSWAINLCRRKVLQPKILKFRKIHSNQTLGNNFKECWIIRSIWYMRTLLTSRGMWL